MSANSSLLCPLVLGEISAGFPTPASDGVDQALDLNKHLVSHPAATFFVRVSGDSMVGAGIHDGDILIVDRALEAAHGRIVVAVLNSECLVKRLRKSGGHVFLDAENADYKTIRVTDHHDFSIWGVVTYVIHAL